MVADRSGAHRRPTHRVARGPHGPVPARRLPARGDQRRTGRRGGRPRTRRSWSSGGEARAWARGGGVESDEERQPPDEVLTRPPEIVAPIEQAAGIVLPPVQQYALIENALGAAEHHGADEQRDEIASLWARFNAVAGDNPAAAFPEPRSAAEIATPGPRNRPLAYPYNRWHASQWTVDQSSALVFCSAERAHAAGVPAERWLFPHVALHCSEAVTLTARRRLWAWPAMAVLGRAAERHIGRPLRELRLAEVYSCFPAAVRVQQRELGLASVGNPHAHGRDDLCRRPVQPLRPAVAPHAGAATARRAGRTGPRDHGVRDALQARTGPLVGLPTRRAGRPAPGRPRGGGDGRHRDRPGRGRPAHRCHPRRGGLLHRDPRR